MSDWEPGGYATFYAPYLALEQKPGMSSRFEGRPLEQRELGVLQRGICSSSTKEAGTTHRQTARPRPPGVLEMGRAASTKRPAGSS